MKSDVATFQTYFDCLLLQCCETLHFETVGTAKIKCRENVRTSKPRKLGAAKIKCSTVRRRKLSVDRDAKIGTHNSRQ